MKLSENSARTVLNNVLANLSQRETTLDANYTFKKLIGNIKAVKSFAKVGKPINGEDVLTNMAPPILHAALRDTARELGEGLPNTYVMSTISYDDDTMGDLIAIEEVFYLPTVLADIYTWMWFLRFAKMIETDPEKIYKEIEEGKITLFPEFVYRGRQEQEGFGSRPVHKALIASAMEEIMKTSILLRSFDNELYNDLISMSDCIPDDIIKKVIPTTETYSLYSAHKIITPDKIALFYREDFHYSNNQGEGFEKFLPTVAEFVSAIKVAATLFVSKYTNDCGNFIKRKIGGKNMSVENTNVATIKHLLKVMLRALQQETGVLQEVTFTNGEKILFAPEAAPAVSVTQEIHTHAVNNTPVNTLEETEDIREHRIGARMRRDGNDTYYQLLRGDRWVPCTRNQYLTIMQAFEDRNTNGEQSHPRLGDNRIVSLLHDIFNNNEVNSPQEEETPEDTDEDMDEDEEGYEAAADNELRGERVDGVVFDEADMTTTNTQRRRGRWTLIDGEYRYV